MQDNLSINVAYNNLGYFKNSSEKLIFYKLKNSILLLIIKISFDRLCPKDLNSKSQKTNLRIKTVIIHLQLQLKQINGI
ncbi:hypothetical protein BpHYR1_041312 [Brachionus plicatilis]|uniref:Uncharacterized protein n=1 Tax=Brachionus plicatilis TaxID=10195 RepID=A0A3M7R531_BRAPC|nr:hypothetical protein BpHYR1_041312 [Brachionus plicatilis]